MPDPASIPDREAIADACFKRVDADRDLLGLSAADAYACLPEHAPARGIGEVRRLFRDVFGIRDGRIQRLPIHPDPDYGDAVRHPWPKPTSC